MKPKIALITGASSGIGLELAHVYAHHGYNLVLVARDVEKLQRVSKTLAREYGQAVEAITLDLTDQGSVQKLLASLKKSGTTVDVLINNAGFGLFGLAVETDPQVERNMIELNIIVLTELSKHFAKAMGKRGSGTIMNVASTASFFPGVYMSVYYATKAYVLSYSQALAEELADSGVHVMALCPGPTKTGFSGRAHLGGSGLFRGAMSARAVAQKAYAGMKRRKRIVIVGLPNQASVLLTRFLPRNLVTRLVRQASSPK